MPTLEYTRLDVYLIIVFPLLVCCQYAVFLATLHGTTVQLDSRTTLAVN